MICELMSVDELTQSLVPYTRWDCTVSASLWSKCFYTLSSAKKTAVIYECNYHNDNVLCTIFTGLAFIATVINH